MPRFRVIKNSFLGGQISRTAVGRTDLPSYPHSCETLQNMIPLLSGGAYRRPGTFLQSGEGAYNSVSLNTGWRPPRLIPFIVSRNEAYAVALTYNASPGAGIATAYRATGVGSYQFATYNCSGNHPYLPNTGTINSFGNYDDEWWNVQHAQSNDVMWLVHPKYKPQVIKRSTTLILGQLVPQFSIGDFDAGLSGLALAQARPYLNQNATSATMAINTATVGTGRTLTCSTAYFNDKMIGAYFAIQSGTLVGSGGGIGFCQVTATAGTIASPSTTATVKVVVAFADTSAHTTWWESAWSDYRGWPRSVCIFQQRVGFGGTAPDQGENTDALGIPAGQPDSIWFSETGGYFKMTALGDGAAQGVKAGVTGTLANGRNYTTPGDFIYYPVDDSQGDGQSTGPIGVQPFRITLASSQLDSIQWMSPSQQLLLGTLTQEWIVAPVNGSFDVANSQATIQSSYGSDYLPAVRIGYELVFPMRSGNEVRAYQYNYFDQSFFGEPIQLFFDEYPKAEISTKTPGRRKFRQMDWDITRNTLWCLDTAGNFFGMTRDRKLQVTMWHTHQMGGYDTTLGVGTGAGTMADPAWGQCAGSVVSFASVPNPISGMNDLWVVVKRVIDGGVVWAIEVMVGANTVRDSAYSPIFPGSQSTEPIYLDCAMIVTDPGDGSLAYQPYGGPFITGIQLTGCYYSQLYGMFVISTTAMDAGGNTSLVAPMPPDYANLAQAHAIVLGLPYTSIVKPVRVDPQGQIGTTQGAIKRISKVYLRLFKTLMLKCGSPPGQSTSPIATVKWAVPASLAQSPEIFTGDKEVFIPATFDRDGYLYIVQDQPLPFTIISMSIEGEGYEQ